MESAIPPHLQQPRTCPRHLAAEQHPPSYPAWTTRFDAQQEKITVAYFAIQSKQPIHFQQHHCISQYFQHPEGPTYWVPSRFTDAQHYEHLVLTAYWSSSQKFQLWFKTSGFALWWQDQQREYDHYGYFLEIYFPDMTQFETIFSSPNTPEGVAHLASKMSDEIQEHGYYGSMRDRLPIAQNNAICAKETDIFTQKLTSSRRRIQLQTHDHFAVIRSGQDWTETTGKEREAYLQHIEPILKQGMQFLAEDGQTEGCFSCRYMQVLDKETGQPIDKTFGLALFKDLAHLEHWAKSHPTHIKIFSSFMHYVQEMDFQIQLKLFHEVMTLPAQSQYFEYIACHAQTGGLATLDLTE